MLCDLCQKNSASCSAIVKGAYYKSVCTSCKLANSQVSSGHARWARSVDLEDHAFDVAQPYNADGSINLDFVQAYPEQAKAVFTDKQILDANRHRPQ